MENIKRINNQLSVAMEQITQKELHEAAEAGFKSVMNFRAADEEGFLSDEQELAENLGLKYVNIPVKVEKISDELTEKVLQKIDEMPKPVLLHCKSGMRSGVMALMNVATRQGMSAEEALEKGRKLGFDCDAHPEMKEFFTQYVSQHSQDI